MIDQTALPRLTSGFCGSLAVPIRIAARDAPGMSGAGAAAGIGAGAGPGAGVGAGAPLSAACVGAGTGGEVGVGAGTRATGTVTVGIGVSTGEAPASGLPGGLTRSEILAWLGGLAASVATGCGLATTSRGFSRQK